MSPLPFLHDAVRHAINEETAHMRVQFIAVCLLSAGGALFQAAANAEVTRCGDANGKTLYTDSACPAGMHAVRVTPVAQTCASEECERRREREIEGAHDRARAEKDQLAAYTTERYRRETEDRRLDEARYEAELRSMQTVPASSDEVVYPVYPIAGYPSRCGKHCFTPPRPRRVGRPMRHSAHRAAPEPRRAPHFVRDR
jgi:hypothetical protein